MGATFTINRIELKKMLTVLKMSERNVDALLAELNKMHRHVNAVTFVGLLQKQGLSIDEISNVLRRIGIDDINISSIFNMIDEQKIKNAYGKVVEIQLE